MVYCFLKFFYTKSLECLLSRSQISHEVENLARLDGMIDLYTKDRESIEIFGIVSVKKKLTFSLKMK